VQQHLNRGRPHDRPQHHTQQRSCGQALQGRGPCPQAPEGCCLTAVAVKGETAAAQASTWVSDPTSCQTWIQVLILQYSGGGKAQGDCRAKTLPSNMRNRALENYRMGGEGVQQEQRSSEDA
jgi:hypothetical protein